MSKDSGGYVFPRRVPDIEVTPDEAVQIIRQHAGVTLRDHFAETAMQEYVPLIRGPGFAQQIARYAYEVADAMIEARK